MASVLAGSGPLLPRLVLGYRTQQQLRSVATTERGRFRQPNCIAAFPRRSRL